MSSGDNTRFAARGIYEDLMVSSYIDRTKVRVRFFISQYISRRNGSDVSMNDNQLRVNRVVLYCPARQLIIMLSLLTKLKVLNNRL